jgi:hypothetical protein
MARRNLKIAVFCDVAPCGSCKNRLFSTLKMEATIYSETSVLTRSKRRHIPEDGIAHSYCREDLKSNKEPLCRLGYSWESNIKNDLKQV